MIFHKYRWNFILFLSLIYVTYFLGFGFEDSDTGFILGLGWRLLGGETPYLDFSYVRPPMSIIHSYIIQLLFNDSYEVLISRIFSSLLIFGGSYFCFSALVKKYGLEHYKLPLILISYLISVSCVSSVFLWHTIDGVFYASLSIYFLSRFEISNNKINILASIFFVCLSVLSKQNFLVVVLVLFSYIIFFRRDVALYAICCFCFFALLGIITLNYVGISELYVNAISGKTELKDIFYSAIVPYFLWLKSKKLMLLLILQLLWSVFFFNKFKLSNVYVHFVPLVSSFLFVLFYSKGSSDPIREFRLDHMFAFFIFVHFMFALIKSVDKVSFLKKHYVMICFLSIAWSASVSWGYNSPLFFVSPMIGYLFFCVLEQEKCRQFKVGCLVLAVIVTFNFYKPYRSENITELSYSMEEISNKLKGIYSSKNMFDKHQELKELDATYDLSVSTVLPSTPLAHYLHNKYNPYYIDWAMDVESVKSVNDIPAEIDNCCKYVFLEKKSIGQPIGEPGTRFYSTAGDYVKGSWVVIESRDYFDVYANPNLP